MEGKHPRNHYKRNRSRSPPLDHFHKRPRTNHYFTHRSQNQRNYEDNKMEWTQTFNERRNEERSFNFSWSSRRSVEPKLRQDPQPGTSTETRNKKSYRNSWSPIKFDTFIQNKYDDVNHYAHNYSVNRNEKLPVNRRLHGRNSKDTDNSFTVGQSKKNNLSLQHNFYNQSAEVNRKKTTVFGYKKLESLACEDDPGVIIHSISDPGFRQRLECTDLKPDWIMHIVTILVKACQSKVSPGSLCDIFTDVIQSKFINNYFLTSKQSEYGMRHQDFLEIFKTMFQLDLKSCEKELYFLFYNWKVSKELLFSSEEKNHLKEIDDINKKKLECEEKTNSFEKATPINFRDLCIIQTIEDLSTRIWLNKLKITGAYNNLDQLLDSQFKLLREDFLRPLREGLEQYRNYTEEQHGNPNHVKIQDLKIYTDVAIEGLSCTYTGLSYSLSFNIKPFRKTRWQSSKRLINGSLVCLSKDNFETVHFAIVTATGPEMLKRGKLEVEFEGNMSLIDQKEKFVMIESAAYFEAYRHILKCLQETKSDFPFQNYLVDYSVLVNVSPPKYLSNNITKPLSFIKLLKADKHVRFAEEKPHFETHSPNYSSPNVTFSPDSPNSKPSSPINISPISPLDNSRFKELPTAEQMGFDQSQHKALCMALTQELAVIQGPPGTGKTFIGLKIVDFLRSNSNVINYPLTLSRSPILIVCYTNHALDQFLSGIAETGCTNIVRVGGRCRNETMFQYTIKERRKGINVMKGGMRNALKKARAKRNDCRIGLLKLISKLNILSKGILTEKELQNVMEYSLFLDLEKEKQTHCFQRSRCYDNIKSFCNPHLSECAMLEWLFNGEKFDDRNWKRKDKTHNRRFVEHDAYDDYDESHYNRDMNLLENSDDNPKEAEAIHRGIENDIVALKLEFDNDSPRWMKEKCSLLERVTAIRNNEKKGPNPYKYEKHMAPFSKQSSIWRLNHEQRWELYLHWLCKYRNKLVVDLDIKSAAYAEKTKRYSELLAEEDKMLMKKAEVIGLTTTGVAKYKHIIEEIKPRVVIIEEAAEVLEAHILTTLYSGCEHLILIGDHQQLRPKPNCYELAERYGLKYSLFERLIKNGFPYATLVTQHRMRPEISKFMRHIYETLDDHQSVTLYDDIKGVQKNICFIGHMEEESQENDLSSKSNNHEAEYIFHLYEYFSRQGYPDKMITILTPYSGQVLLLRQKLPRKSYESLRIVTIDDFQGEENDIILLSLVRSNKENKIGFLKEDNRICVALSRAKKGLFVLGNFSMLTATNNLWKKIIDTARTVGSYSLGLGIGCQKHPDDLRIVKTANDFKRLAPMGGCRKFCDFRFSCGHSCKQLCHPNDHDSYQCQSRCNKEVCNLGHKCKLRCHIGKCGKCTEMIPKTIPACGHNQNIECGKEVTDVTCQRVCEVLLDCKHICTNKCGETHTNKCKELVDHQLYCGHSMKDECWKKTYEVLCKQRCNSQLDCGHACSGSCGMCLNGKIHTPCRKRCKRILACGHECESICNIECPPCTRRCENVCDHSKCDHICGGECYPCKEDCFVTCRHKICETNCSDICDKSIRCNEPCVKLILNCMHKCIGLCGETCPSICRVCNKDEVETIFFGTEEEEDSRFIELIDCGHVLEVSGMDQWMDTNDEESISIQFKSCPKCSTKIRKSKRYHSNINKTMENINQVKGKIWGSKEDILSKEKEFERVMLHLDPDAEEKLRQIFNKILKRYNRKISLPAITYLINMGNIVHKLVQVKKQGKDIYLKVEEENLIGRQLAKGLYWQVKKDLEWCFSYREEMSEQEVKEIQLELQRLHLFKNTLSLLILIQVNKPTISKEQKHIIQECQNKLKLAQVIAKEDMEKYAQVVQEITKKATGLGVTEEERLEITKAIGLKKGHWYKCPNGHVYCIGECGGAMQKSQCPECSAEIGGTSHRLTDGNLHAPEMDGSSFAAWSAEANDMANFQFDN